jgi:hypothetical protein
LLTAWTIGASANSQTNDPEWSRRIAEPGTLVLPVADEIPGQATRTYFQYLSNPEIAQRSWAAIVLQGNKGGTGRSLCSGIMIGPNMMLTAAHCGAEWVSGAKFIAYTSPTTKIEESFVCGTLLFGWPETDIDLVWCGANGGVNPGDRWGYVDLDVDVDARLKLFPLFPLFPLLTPNRVVTGRPIYSIWWNPITAIGGGDHMLFSDGTIAKTNASGWYNMGGSPCSQADDNAEGVDANVYGIGGASGSSLLSSTTHRLLLGPTSTAPRNGGVPRNVASALNQLTRTKLSADTSGLCAQRSGQPVNAAALQTLWDAGIKFDPDRNNTSKYYDVILDKDRNGIFDVQQDLERSAGERQRNFYNLGFDSLRRAALWQRPSPAQFTVRPFWGSVSIGARPGPWQQAVIASPQLHLAYPATHWVRYHVHSTGQSRLRMRVGGGQFVENLAAGADRVVVREVKGTSVAMDVAGLGTITLSDITVWNPAKPFSFDMFDERKVWKRRAVTNPQPATEDAAIFMPHSRTGVTGPNWAGVIRAHTEPVVASEVGSGGAIPIGTDDRLFTQAMATPLSPGGGRVQVCFDHRLPGAISTTMGAGRLSMAGLTGSDHQFSSSSSWHTTCTTTRRGNLRSLEFRAVAPPVGTTTIFIDNVRLTWTPIPIVVGGPVHPSTQ